MNYEAQAAIELEMAIANDGDDGAYPIDFTLHNGVRILRTRRLFQEILSDMDQRVTVGTIARKFHNALIEIFTSIARAIRDESSLNRVCLSGGTFHNAYLFAGLQKQLTESGFDVFVHSQVPAGDGGLSLGQAMVAAHQRKR